ncbi:MAG: calcium-binding protein [Hyphomicrobium sp.]|nr:calcium-binding protein [Hyphomicrobium sp.]
MSDTLSSTDQDAGATATFSLTNTAGGRFTIVGNEIRVANSVLLDFEQNAQHTVRVLVTDQGALTTFEDFTITIGDINPENVMGDRASNTLVGGAGSDVINGGGGNDILRGQGGDDRYFVDAAMDQVIEIAGGGTMDRVFASVNYTPAATAYVEVLSTLSTTSTDLINLTGNAFANSIIGNAAGNILNGGGGVDNLLGYAGNDTYIVDNAADAISETAGSDTVRASVSYTLGAGDQIERIETTNAALNGVINLTGNEFGQTITGNAGANRLAGLAGSDTLLGLAGSDVLAGGTGLDTLTGGAGNDAFVFNVQLIAANRDTISDFSNVGQNDVFHLENTGAGLFSGLANGALNAAMFRANATGTAGDANDRIIYNTTTGALFFDSNGNVEGGLVQFATLSTKPVLTAADFFVI